MMSQLRTPYHFGFGPCTGWQGLALLLSTLSRMLCLPANSAWATANMAELVVSRATWRSSKIEGSEK